MGSPISPYRVAEMLCESGRSRICRAQLEPGGEHVVLKFLKPEAATEETIARFKREFDVISKIELPGVAKAYGLEDGTNGLIMALEDIGGQSLDRLMKLAPLSSAQFLEAAIGLSDILARLHQQRIIHGDICPAHIIYNSQTGAIRLIGFGAASGQGRGGGQTPSADLVATPVLAQDLLYISPEQTGRINRAVDYRTDFYSLGVTFYELLTGRPPFQAEDALGMAHATSPRRPLRRTRSIHPSPRRFPRSF